MKIVQPYHPNTATQGKPNGGALPFTPSLNALKGFGGKGYLPEALVRGTENELPKDLEGACRAMEQQFMELVLDSMRKAFIPSDAKGSAGFSKDMSMSMLQTEVAKMTTQNEGMGLWKVMYDQLAPEKDAGVKFEKIPAEKPEKGILRKMGHIVG